MYFLTNAIRVKKTFFFTTECSGAVILFLLKNNSGILSLYKIESETYLAELEYNSTNPIETNVQRII